MKIGAGEAGLFLRAWMKLHVPVPRATVWHYESKKTALVNFMYCVTAHNSSCIRVREMFTFTPMPHVFLLRSHPIITVLCLQFAFCAGPFIASLHYEVKRVWNFIQRPRMDDAILKYLHVMADNSKLCLREIGRAGVGCIHMTEDQKHCWGPSEHCNEILSCIKRWEICVIPEWRFASCSRLFST